MLRAAAVVHSITACLRQFVRGLRARQVTALGHSAGAQLWCMALLGRARAARLRPRPCSQGPNPGSQDTGGGGGAYTDARVPSRFVGMAGVYDIGQHYRYEAARGLPHGNICSHREMCSAITSDRRSSDCLLTACRISVLFCNVLWPVW